MYFRNEGERDTSWQKMEGTPKYSRSGFCLFVWLEDREEEDANCLMSSWKKTYYFYAQLKSHRIWGK